MSKKINSKKEKGKPTPVNFQDTILNLQKFWGNYGCIILQPYDIEVGAGTFHPATTLRSLGTKPWKAAYVQPSRRPTDGRYGKNPNRLQHHYQFQVIIKPSPDEIKKVFLRSLSTIGINHKEHDIRFVEDDWESPTLGAAGLGWEVWCDGMEITQFTYFQKMTGIECKPVPVELTYGLERICMFTQGKKNVFDLIWNNSGMKYRDIFHQAEKENSNTPFLEWLNPKNKKKFTWGETSINIYKLAKVLKENHLIDLNYTYVIFGRNNVYKDKFPLIFNEVNDVFKRIKQMDK